MARFTSPSPKQWIRGGCMVLGILAPLFFFSTALQPWSFKKSNFLILQNIAFPIQFASYHIRSISHSFWEDYIALRALRVENIKLEAKVKQLETELIGYAETKAELTKLFELLEFRRELAFPTSPATVVTSHLSSPFKMTRIAISNAKKVGIKDPVILPSGVVGRVMRVGKSFADVQLLTDLNSHVDALVQRTRSRGILSGLGTKFAKLHFQSIVDVKIGDEIITSGVIGDFPKGLPLGEVVKIGFAPDNVTQTIIIKPRVNFDDISEVLIVHRGSKNISADLDGSPQDQKAKKL